VVQKHHQDKVQVDLEDLLVKDLVGPEDHLDKVQVDLEDHPVKGLVGKDSLAKDLEEQVPEDQMEMDKRDLSHKVLWKNVHVLMSL